MTLREYLIEINSEWSEGYTVTTDDDNDGMDNLKAGRYFKLSERESDEYRNIYDDSSLNVFLEECEPPKKFMEEWLDWQIVDVSAVTNYEDWEQYIENKMEGKNKARMYAPDLYINICLEKGENDDEIWTEVKELNKPICATEY